MKAVNPDAGAEMMAANWLLDELCVPADFGTRAVVAEAIRLEAKRMNGIEKAAKVILSAAQYAQRAGDLINRFWFTDQKYLRRLKIEPGTQNQIAVTEDEAHQMWLGMSDEYKKQNPWKVAQ